MADAPDELTTFVTLATAPPAEPFPPKLHGQRLAIVTVAWCGADHAEGERAIAPLRAKGGYALDLIGPIPFVAFQSMLDGTAPAGGLYYDRLHYLPEVSDGFVSDLLGAFEHSPTPQTHVNVGWMGGAVNRLPQGATAFGQRGAGAFTWLIGATAEEPFAPVVEWVRRTWEATRGFASGSFYVNALYAGGSVRDAYEPDVYERLVEIKRRYDPSGAFSGNGIGAAG
jgi:hypothetical protein